ncbi:cupin domain-containing protein [Planktomarina temperata]|nr:cupin domain-containing protein [Planktomarina temperata]MDB2454070.1 cupin domain-containing protein [Planktomarina temperata]
MIDQDTRKESRMPYPDFITAFPSIDVPFPDDVVQTAVVRSDNGLVAFFTFLRDMELPPHSHGAQWGTVVEGQIEFTIGGETKIYRAGDSYSIPAGVEHGALIKSGTRVIDVFEEADRYSIKQ